MKVVFLDIDGVVVRLGEGMNKYRHDGEGGLWSGGIISTFDPDLAEMLRKLWEETGCNFVISSTWRHGMMWELNEEFKKYGIPRESILWVTPTCSKYGRENEILWWLMTYHANCEYGEHVEQWVAIDDDSNDMQVLAHLGRFVNTDCTQGLTEADLTECMHRLNGNVGEHIKNFL